MDELVGHLSVKKMLIHMLQTQKVPHALLFHGPQGVGKTSFAKAFAHNVVGSTRSNHPDVRIYEPEGENPLHTITTIRQLKEEALEPPFEASYKVLIIKDAHKMLPTSSNALLKALEEPIDQCKIILLTHALSELLPTIVSRCCKVAFSPLSSQEIVQCLVTRSHVEPLVAEKIAERSFGSLKAAFDLMTTQGECLWQEALCDVVLNSHHLSYGEVQKKLSFLEEEVEKKGDVSKQQVYEMVLRVLRDLLVVSSSSQLFFPKLKNSLQVAASHISLSAEKIEKIWHESYMSLFANVKLKIGLERLLLQLYS